MTPSEWAKTAWAKLDFLRSRKKAYQLCFGSAAGHIVMRDLIVFCRGTQSCFHDDARKHAVLEGRREVLLRITNHMNLTSEQLYILAEGTAPPKHGDS